MDFGTIFKRALLDTIGFFAKNFLANPRNLSLPLLFIAGTATHLYRFGWNEAMEEFNVFISYGIIPVGSFVILLFVSNLILAPSRILYEAICSGNPKIVKEKIKKPISYEAWDLLNEFKLHDIIGFLSGGSPYGGDLIQKDVYERMFIAAADGGELKLISDYREWKRHNYLGIAFDELKATRKALIDLMEMKGLKPPLLFPEKRK